MSLVSLRSMCAAFGIDMDDIIDRIGDPCMCGHAMEEHEGEVGADPCKHEGCGCSSYGIPPKMEER